MLAKKINEEATTLTFITYILETGARIFLSLEPGWLASYKKRHNSVART